MARRSYECACPACQAPAGVIRKVFAHIVKSNWTWEEAVRLGARDPNL